MKFLDICRNPNNSVDGDIPYLLVIQGDYIAVKSTRVVVPLMKTEAVSGIIAGLMPQFFVEGQPVVMVMPNLAGISVRSIGPVVANAADHHHEVRRAIDILTGDF